MKDSIFREYDIRGIVGSEFIIDEVYNVVRAIAYYFKQHNPDLKTIAVGMDGRTHSPAIKEHMCRALQESGLDVVFVGVCPSPALYFALHQLPVDGGLMITASHNPKEYNGIKICLGKQSVWGDRIRAIRDAYHAGKYIESDQHGLYYEHDIISQYVEWFAQHFKHLIGMDMPIVIDSGNGSGGSMLPQLVKRMQWPNVQLLCVEVDGDYPNHEADPIKKANMQHVKDTLQNSNAVVGFGLDGDCDRMAPMTKDGYLVPGDELLAIFARDVLKDHPKMAVVFDIKSSGGLIELLKQWGAKPIVSPSGHAIIKEHMKKNHGVLGGELSCHFFFNDRFFGYDDGIYALFRLIELLIKSDQPLRYFVDQFPKKYSSPEYRIAYNEAQREEIIQTMIRAFQIRDDVAMITVDGVRATMPYGWGIIRPSNTQPVMCLRFEANTPQELQKVKKDFMDILTPYFQMSDVQKIVN